MKVVGEDVLNRARRAAEIFLELHLKQYEAALSDDQKAVHIARIEYWRGYLDAVHDVLDAAK